MWNIWFRLPLVLMVASYEPSLNDLEVRPVEGKSRGKDSGKGKSKGKETGNAKGMQKGKDKGKSKGKDGGANDPAGALSRLSRKLSFYEAVIQPVEREKGRLKGGGGCNPSDSKCGGQGSDKSHGDKGKSKGKDNGDKSKGKGKDKGRQKSKAEQAQAVQWNMLDRNKDGNISNEEIWSRMGQEFKQFKNDGVGEIINRFFSGLHEDTEYLISIMDRNEDRNITWEEFLTAAPLVESTLQEDPSNAWEEFQTTAPVPNLEL